jgi:hypothetical protein
MYIETILTDETTTVELNQTVVVSRARVGLHLILSSLVERLLQALIDRNPYDAADSINEYVARAVDMPLPELLKVDPKRTIRAFLHLERFNRLRVDHIISLKQPVSTKANAPIPYSFPGRQYAMWVHKLASTYHWTRHYIMDNLLPEEVLIYLQEIAVS